MADNGFEVCVDPAVTVATGDEPFDPRGDGTDVEQVAAGEIAWRDPRDCHLDRLERHAA